MGNWTPSIMPDPDQTVYLVLEDFGRHGRAWCETDAEACDLETVITYLQTRRLPANRLARRRPSAPVHPQWL
jgi:hypothetical protein